MPLARLLARIRTVGFEGPFYEGISGKLRFVLEAVAWRREFVFLGTRDSLASAVPPVASELELLVVDSFDGVKRFEAELDGQYYPGFLQTWRRPFTWGEQLVVGILGGRIAAFAWVQRGTTEGFPTYYGRLLDRDARILRVGVAPSFRRRGLNSRMMYSVLERLLESGCVRVFAESHKYNLPSVRTFLKAGFRVVGVLTVLRVPGRGEVVRWSSDDVERHLRDLAMAR